MKERKRAVIVGFFIGILFVGSLAAYFLIQNMAKQKDDNCYARLYQDGKLIEEINLSEVEETYQKTIQSPQGGYNVVEIRHDSIGVVDADCPDKLCQKQGFTAQFSNPIVCLPHRLSIEITYQEEKKEPDAISE